MFSQELFRKDPIAFSGGLRVLFQNSESNRRRQKRYKFRTRVAQLADIPGMVKLEQEAWEPTGTVVFDESHFRSQIGTFPEGQILLEVSYKDDQGKSHREIVALFNSRKGSISEIKHDMTWAECTDDGYIRNHDPEGKILFPVNQSFLPKAESLGGLPLLDGAVIALAVTQQCRAIVFGSRIPRLAKFNCKLKRRGKPPMDGREYATKRRGNGRFLDPLVAQFMRIPFMEYIEVIDGYFEDPESENLAALMACHNPLYLYHLSWLYKPVIYQLVGWLVVKLLANGAKIGA